MKSKSNNQKNKNIDIKRSKLSHISKDLDRIIMHILEIMKSNQYIDSNDSYLAKMDRHLFFLQSVIHDIKIKSLLESDVMKKLNCLRGLLNQNKAKQGLVIDHILIIFNVIGIPICSQQS